MSDDTLRSQLEHQASAFHQQTVDAALACIRMENHRIRTELDATAKLGKYRAYVSLEQCALHRLKQWAPRVVAEAVSNDYGMETSLCNGALVFEFKKEGEESITDDDW